MGALKELPVIHFESALAWETWLAEQHPISPGLWLKIAKKESGLATVTYAEALDVALCYGWIDGQKGAFDATFWLQLFTPRRPQSRWSEINRDKATALMEKGLMRPAGLREVERAKADGRWDAAYPSRGTMSVPDDLQAALDENPAARDYFATLDRQNLFAILYRIHDAKRPDTRARRIAEFVRMLGEGKKPYP